MSTSRRLVVLLLCASLVASVLSLSSCGGSSSDSSTRVTRVVVIPTISSVEVNDQQTFTANALDKDGNTVNGVTFTWASSDSDVAPINTDGVATGKSGGTTQITATASSGGVTSSPATLAVLPDIASVTIAPITATIKVGGRQQFVATAKDVKGNTVNAAVFNWAISFSGVATIDKNGVATGMSSGTALVTCSTGGVTSPVATLNVTN